MFKNFEKILVFRKSFQFGNKSIILFDSSKNLNLYKTFNKQFCEKDHIENENRSGSKIIKVEIDENNNRKIIFEDYDEHLKNNPSESEKKQKKSLPKKFKFFGIENENAALIEEEISNKISSIFEKEKIEENLIDYKQYFSDKCRIYIKAGDGGNGNSSVIKGPMFDDRTPQGGDGGDGGDVIFIADETVPSLSYLRKSHIFGNDGRKGLNKSQGGRYGKSIHIHLPVGTIVNEIIRDEKYSFKKRELRAGEYQTKFLIDLDEPGKQFIIAKGGRKGIGNSTKRNITSESPMMKGKAGEEKELELTLKCYADVGLIGFPNAGKSTLLGALTRAVPKIANYPFTTLHPHIGKLKFYDSYTLTVADLPGLIEGAHLNKGLGHKFLKHIERAKILIIVLDGSLDPLDKRSPLNDIATLTHELSMYNKNYLEKQFLIALNKCDSDEINFKKNLELLSSDKNFINKEIITISAKLGIGLEILSQKLREKTEKIKH